MSKKVVAILIGALLIALLAGTATAGSEGYILRTTTTVVTHK